MVLAMKSKVANSAIKVALLAIALYLLSLKLDGQHLSTIDIKLKGYPLYFTLLAFAGLFSLNIALDAYAWQKVQGMLRAINLKEAFFSNLKAYALAFITPFNSGELAGRYLAQNKKDHKQKAVFLTFWAHMPKLFSKLLVGLPLAVFLLAKTQLNFNAHLALALGCGLLILLFFKLEKLVEALRYFRLEPTKLKRYYIEGRPSASEKLMLLLINAMRFLCFSGQMALVLHIFEPSLLSLTLLASLPIYYLAAALVPTWAAADFLVKGVLSLYFFSFFTEQTVLFALGSVVVWFFNVALPAVMGLAIFNPAQLKSFRLKKN